MNLQLNIGKMKPASLARCLEAMLSQGQALKQSAEDLDDCAWREAQLRRDRVGPFVTHLVETMSRLGTERLTGRFGAAAAEQLQDLHELVHLRIEDDEVREDTRLAFASHRLASGFLGEEGSPSDAAEIARIRQSIGEAVERAPAKFSLWRAVVRAAMRRPFSTADGTSEATEWLAEMLQRIALSSAREWLRAATTDGADCCSKQGTKGSRRGMTTANEVLDLHASFLRAIFWRELRHAISDLRRVPGAAPRAPNAWSTSAWTFRALDETSSVDVLEWASQLDRWAVVLYADSVPPVDYWWEYESLALTCLATKPATDATAPAAGRHRLAKTVTTGSEDDHSGVMRMLRQADRVATKEEIVRLGPFDRLLLASMSAPVESKAATSALLRELARVGHAPGLRLAQRLGVTLEYVQSKLRTNSQRKLELDRTIWDLESAALARQHILQRTAYSASGPYYIEDVMWASKLDGETVTVEPNKVPRRGLPVRIALRLFTAGLQQAVAGTSTWWTLPDGQALARARLETLRPGARTTSRGALQEPAIRLVAKQNPSVPMHPAYLLAERWGAERGSIAHRALCQIWQFFFAAEGSETSLTNAVLAPDRSLPLEEQWRLRSRIPLPSLFWKALDTLLQYIRELPQLEDEVRGAIQALAAIAEDLLDDVSLAEFDWDRTDIRLELDGGPLDVPMGRVSLHAPAVLAIDYDELPREISVRLAQLTAKPDWTKYYDAFKAYGGPPPIKRADRQAVMRQVYEAFASRTGNIDGPIIMPEVSIPHEELTSLRSLVSVHRRSVLAGLYWREPAMSSGSRARAGVRYLVNEAVLIAPVSSPHDPALPVVREFRIRKPIPAHIEDGLCAAVSTAKTQWEMLDGRVWFRFVHPVWGDFTVAICSDLVDPTPWASMSGAVLHLFLVSYNEDVDLFEQMTWIRAFELHCNVVAANHGAHGGSFVWTPRSAHAKEVARLRGEGLLLFADVALPVQELADNQRRGVERAVRRAKKTWETLSAHKKAFKSPRPRYPGRR